MTSCQKVNRREESRRQRSPVRREFYLRYCRHDASFPCKRRVGPLSLPAETSRVGLARRHIFILFTPSTGIEAIIESRRRSLSLSGYAGRLPVAFCLADTATHVESARRSHKFALPPVMINTIHTGRLVHAKVGDLRFFRTVGQKQTSAAHFGRRCRSWGTGHFCRRSAGSTSESQRRLRKIIERQQRGAQTEQFDCFMKKPSRVR